MTRWVLFWASECPFGQVALAAAWLVGEIMVKQCKTTLPFQPRICFRVRGMQTDKPQTLFYKRSRFVTHLPVHYLYSPSHSWIARHDEAGRWRVGLTKFATRMLGDMVDHGFEVTSGAPVQIGQVIGWVEGFKAISDIFCIAAGNFTEPNRILKEKITLVTKDPYGAGWLYLVSGTPDSTCVDVHTYKNLLDKTIDKILEQQKGEEIK